MAVRTRIANVAAISLVDDTHEDIEARHSWRPIPNLFSKKDLVFGSVIG